jgi:putative cell wall-binding protein
VVRRLLLSVVLSALALGSTVGVAHAEDTVVDHGPLHPMVFPVIGNVSYTDTFGAPRSGGRTHEGQDLMGHKMQELAAAADGRISAVKQGGTLSGNMVVLEGDDGWTYWYIHLNNDTPGTDDGAAPASDTFGPGIEVGAEVVAGQLIGYMGDSGDAENTGTHLHFELADPDGVTVNAYTSLQNATHVGEVAGSTPSPIPRLAGLDRVGTAIEVSQAGWPDGAADVVIAAGDQYAEALPASVLAAAKNGPLLLTVGTTVPATLLAELDRLHAARVTVVGSVPTTVSDAIAATTRVVTRIGADHDATSTAVAIAQTVGGSSGVAVLVNDGRFADGVSAATIAAGRGWPVLLTTAAVVPQKTVDAWRALGVRKLVIVGGTAVVSTKIETFAHDAGKCAGLTGCDVERLAGDDRYGTSVAVATKSLSLGGRSASTVLLGTGTAYPDVLAAGPLASKLGGVSLLVDGSGLGADDASRTFLSSNATSVGHVEILGGSGAVSGSADRALQKALGLT